MTVINIKDAPIGWKDNPDYVYIGRTGKGMYGSWGNPFGMRNEEDRTHVIQEYVHWLYTSPQPYLNKMYWNLRGKTLVCFCKPKPCHGDIIEQYINNRDIE